MDTRTTAWVAYLTLIGWIIALVQYSNSSDKSSLVLFHLRQMFGLMVLYAGVWVLMAVLSYMPGSWALGWVLYVALFILWLLGLLGAVSGEEKPIPILGPLFQQWFQFLK